MSLASLGMFVFALDTLPYQQLQQQLAWRHAANPRVGKRPARQFLGIDDETISIDGVLYPQLTGGELHLKELRDMADTGDSYPLIDGAGNIFGEFVIESLETTRQYFFDDGTARKIEFKVKLVRADDERVAPEALE